MKIVVYPRIVLAMFEKQASQLEDLTSVRSLAVAASWCRSVTASFEVDLLLSGEEEEKEDGDANLVSILLKPGGG